MHFLPNLFSTNTPTRTSQQRTYQNGKNLASPGTRPTQKSPTTGTAPGQPSTTSMPTPSSASTSTPPRLQTSQPHHRSTAATGKNPSNPLTSTPPLASSPNTSTACNQTGTTSCANATVSPSTVGTSTQKRTGNSSPWPSHPSVHGPKSSTPSPSGSTRQTPIAHLQTCT